MKPKLLLYFDTNIILSVSCDAGGRTHEADIIYYTVSPNSSQIDDIKNFYQKTTGVDTIDTHFVFAETMEYAFRKSVLQLFQKEGIKPKSFTNIPSIILTDYVMKQGNNGNHTFGDNVVVIYSNDNSLRLTGTIYDGLEWQWNVSNYIIPNVGNSPLKRSLVESLINKRDNRLGAIDERNRARETEFQMQFADDWLAVYKGLESKDDLTVDFKFSFDDTSVRLRMPKREIEHSYEQILAPAISGIAGYKEKKCSNSVKYVILAGPAFEEENFTFKVKTALDCEEQFSVIPYSRLSLILANYLEVCDSTDDFDKFDKISIENEKLHKSSIEWIKHAQLLTEFYENITVELGELVKRVADDEKNLNSIISTVNANLEKSAFGEAREALGKISFPSVLVNNSIQEAKSLLAKSENMGGIFAKLECVDGARLLINKIRDKLMMLRNEIAKSQLHSETVANKNSRIDFCEAHYNDFLDLKREFNNASDYKKKKALVLEMRELSEEPMPELKLRQVLAEIKYTKEKVKTGLFKRKDVIHITVSVKDSEVLPCNALLNISNKVQVRASEGDADCIAFEIEKGESTFSVTVESPDSHLDFLKSIYCYLFVGKNVLDKSAIRCEPIVIK